MSGPLGPNLLDRLTASAPPPPARPAPTPNLLDKLAAPSPVRPTPAPKPALTKPAPTLPKPVAPRPAPTPNLLDKLAAPPQRVKPTKAPLKTDAQLLGEELEKLKNEVWPTHIDPANPISLHNAGALALYPLKVMGEGFNVVNRALPRFVPGYQNLLDKLSASVNANEAQLRADDARAQQAIADSYQGAPPMPSSLTAHPPAPPSLTSANPIDQEAARRERARAAAYQQLYSDPRSTETYVQQVGRALSPLGDLADPRLSTYGEDIGEATHNPYLGMALDMLAPAPGAGLSKLSQLPGRMAEFLAGGAKFSKAELLAQRTAQLAENARLADMAERANMAAKSGIGRLAETERMQDIRRTMTPFEPPTPAPPKLHIPEAAPAPPKIHIPEAAPAPPKLHIPEAAPEPNLLDKLTGGAPPKLHIPEAAPDLPTAPPRAPSPDYLATLKPAKARKGKQPKPAGQGDVFSGPALSTAPAPPRNLLDELTAPEPGPWKPAELPGPVRPDLEYRPGPEKPPEAPAAPYAPDPTAPIDPAARMGQVFRAAANRLGFTPEKMARPYGAYLTAGDVRKVFEGTGTPQQVNLVTKALGMDFGPQGMRWTPPRGARNVASWNEQLEMARAFEIAPPPVKSKAAPMQAGYRAMQLNKPEPPKPASFFDEIPRGDARPEPRSEVLHPGQVESDAATYQFKAGGDEAGVTDRLKGVTSWNRAKAGKVIVHERLDGRRFIADGHQRLGLAKRLAGEGKPAQLDALVYREADGYSPADLRVEAAAVNIAQGSGTAVDAAKVIREAGAQHAALADLPRSSAVARDGKQLAKLGPKAFEQVVNGVVKPEFGAHVGQLIQGDAAQLGALKALKRLKPGSSTEALSIVQDIRAQGLAKKTEQGGLFGAEDLMEDLLGERAKIFSAAQNIATKDRSIFRAIVSNEGRFKKAGNVLAESANRAEVTDAERVLAGLEEVKYVGPVAKKLNELSRRLKAKELSPEAAAREFLDTVRSESSVAQTARDLPGGGAVDEVERIPDIEGQESFFSMEQGTGRRRQGRLFEREREARPNFPEPPKVKGAGQGRLIPEAPKDPNAPKAGERMPAPYDFAGQKVQLGKMDVARRLPMPALVKLSKSLTGRVPDVSKALQSLSKRMGARINGRFREGQVQLNPDIFANEDMASKVLGHEIGHVLDLVGPQQGQVKAFSSQLAAEMRKAPELYAEAKALSREWRPYDAATATPKFLKYREAAEEVIADFLSAFLNDAAYAQQAAPKLTQAFFKTLEARPKVQEALLEVNRMMDGTMHDFHANVAREVDTSFLRAEDLWKAIAEQRKAREDSFWRRMVDQADELRYLFSDVGGEAKRRAQRYEDAGGLKGAYDPRVSFDEYSMSGNRIALMADDWQKGVVAPLREAELAESDFGRYLFAQRIVGERAHVANPLGVTERNAKAILSELAGKDGAGVLERAAKRARKLYSKALREAMEAGAVSREEFDLAKQSADSFAEFRLVEDLHKRIAGDLKGPAGTFEDIANPATAAFMKAVALRNVAETNRAKAGMVEFLTANAPNEIRVAKTNELPKYGERSFEVLEDGKKVTYLADKWLSDTFDGERFDRLAAVVRAWTSFDQKFKALWITFNLGFQAMNLGRDAMRTTRSLSALGVTRAWDPTNILKTFGSYRKSLPDAWKYAQGEVTPLLRQMIEDYAIAPPGETVTDILAGDTKLEQELMKTGNLQARPEPRMKGLKPAWNRPADTALDFLLNARRTERAGLKRALIPVDNALNFIRELGGTLEAVPKIAGYQRLKKAGYKGAQRAAHVRDFVGTPNFKVKGAATRITNAAFVFSNIAIQGWKADLRLATAPSTRGAFWMETFKHGIMPKLLMAGAAYGAFGGELREMMAGISEYDKTQFICLPMGWEESGEHRRKVRFLRLPMDETTRFFSGLAWKALNGPQANKDAEDWATDVFAFAKGQVPGLGPTATLFGEAAQVAAGKNPEDEFRGRPKIRKTEFEAGGSARWGGFLKASLGNFGMVGEAIRNEVETGSKPETRWAQASIPGLNRFFRVSDRGYSEQQDQKRHNADKAKANLKLGYGTKTKELVGTHSRLQQLGRGHRTPAQDRAYRRIQSFVTGPYRRTTEQVQRLLDDGHTLDAQRLQEKLEKRAAPYYAELNLITGRTER